MVRGVDMTTWQPAMAPNYFPEMLIYGLISYGTKSIYLGFMGFRLVKAILYAFLFFNLLSFITGLSRTYRLWVVLFLSCGMMLAAILVGGTQDFWQLYVPTAHGGAFVNALGAIVIMLHWLRKPKKNQWGALILLVVLSTVATLSDMIYVVWFTIPAMVVMGILVVLRRITKRSLLLFVACFLIPVLLERMSYLITPYKEVLGSSLALNEGWKATSDLYLSLLAEGWYHQIVLVSFICLVGLTLYVLFSAWKKLGPDQVYDAKETGRLFLLSNAALIAPLNFLAMAAINRPAPQYLIGGNLASLSFLLFVLIMTNWGQRLLISGSFYITVIIFVIAGFVGFLAYSPPNWDALAQKLNPMQQIYPDLVACLDSHAGDLGNGV